MKTLLEYYNYFFYTVLFRQFSIYVGNDAGPPTPFDVSKYSLCAKMCGRQSRSRALYNCVSQPRGRHVAVQMDFNDDPLIFCEIEVYSQPAAGMTLPNNLLVYCKTKYGICVTSNSLCIISQI